LSTFLKIIIKVLTIYFKYDTIQLLDWIVDFIKTV